MSLKDKAKQDEQSEHSSRGRGFLKFHEGKNKIRVLSEPMVIFKDFNYGICYTDCRFQGSMKYLAYVIDYEMKFKLNEDGSNVYDEQHQPVKIEVPSIKLMEMPKTIFDNLAEWEMDEDYKFTAFPMPYDISINAENAGTKEMKYTATPRPTRTDVPAKILEDLATKKSIPELIVAMKEKNKTKHQQDGTWAKLHEEGGAKKMASTATDRSQLDYPQPTHEELNDIGW